MTGDKIKIAKVYRVFNLGVSSDESMDEPDETQLYGWLTSKGYSEEKVAHIIHHIEERGEITITLPSQDPMPISTQHVISNL
jgi:hypothetical protein